MSFFYFFKKAGIYRSLSNLLKMEGIPRMLQAKSKDGRIITLASLTKQEISKARQAEFFCPTCNESLLVKAGVKTIAHFAHRTESECSSNDHGEGPYHEQGKLMLFQWLKSQGIGVELEKYLPEISQRPDIFVSLNHRRIAIEYQCARIPVDILNSRNAGYNKAGITPIWILGANHFKRIRQKHFHIDQFILSFMHRFSTEFPLTLYFFCPHTRQFITIQHIQITTPRNAIGQFRFTNLSEMNVTNLFIKQQSHELGLFELWKKEKQAFRLQQNNRLYGAELAWHKWLYKKRTHKEQLPSIVHLPVCGQYLMKTKLGNWQSRLVLNVIDPIPIGSTFTLQNCHRLFHYQTQQFSLLKAFDDPIYQYLQLLTILHIIEEIEPHIFKKMKEIQFHKNIEDSLKEDARLMNWLIEYSTIR